MGCKKDVGIERMENFLNCQSKFQKIALKHDHFLNFVASQEKRINKTL